MKALSVKNPFACHISAGLKTKEYRTWSTAHRGDLLICSSLVPAQGGEYFARGVSYCVVDLFDIERTKVNGSTVFVWHFRNVRRVEKVAVRGAVKLFDVPDAKIVFLPKGEQETIAERIARASDFVRRAYKGESTTREGIARDAFKEKVFEVIASAGFPVVPYDLVFNIKKEPVDIFDMVNTLKLEGRIVASTQVLLTVALPLDVDRVESPLEYREHFFTVE